MNRDEVKRIINSNPASFLQAAPKKVNGKPSYICPFCGNGSGADGDGIAENPHNPQHYKCLNCGAYGDMIDYMQKKYNINYNEALQLGAKLNGIEIDQPKQKANKMFKPIGGNENMTDYSAFFEEAHNNLSKTDYLTKRGISKEIQDYFNVGYIEEWKHPKAPNNIAAKPVIIIPINNASYLARDTRKDINETEQRYTKQKVGGNFIFNVNEINKNKPLFVVEGEIDTMSVMELGYSAIGLGSTANQKKLISILEENKRNKKIPIILSLDNDKAGIGATENLLEELRAEGYTAIKVNISKEFNDPNEALINDREGFKESLKSAITTAEETLNEELEEYKKNSAKNYVDLFFNGVKDSAGIEEIKTGFEDLDKLLDAGLYEGLYILGAVTSLGKTTFLLQMADQIAKSGQDVLIISLEMSRNELIAKSISRNTIIRCLDEGIDTKNAKTTVGISNGRRYKFYNETEHELIDNAVKDYSSYADHIYIHEGLGDIGVATIRELVGQHEAATGQKPVLMIDYLQILAPYNDKYSEKQNTDANVRELKRISRDYKTPVLAISSFNRENYKRAVDLTAFKESGGIEYSSDVLIGIQLKKTGESDVNLKELMDKEPREIEVHILKNRNGVARKHIDLEYYPKFNYFREP